MARVITGRTVLYWLLGTFAIVFAVNGIFITEALTTFRGGDEQHPYQQGVDFNRTLERRSEQAALGWQASIAVRDRQITVSLKTRDGEPVLGEKLEGELRHPSDASLDRALSFHQAAPGLYVADVGAAQRGAWDATVRASNARKPFEASRRLWLH